MTVLDRRRAGVLLHPTSLPGPAPTGRLGAAAQRFLDWLTAAGFRLWQVLPLTPPHDDGSPYQALSSFAGDTRLLDPQGAVAAGWLAPDEASRPDWTALAHAGFRRAGGEAHPDYQAFCRDQAHWLDDFARFLILRQRFRRPWNEWPLPYRDRHPEILATFDTEAVEALDRVRFEQYLFERQWLALRHEANRRDVRLFGDLPIFVAHDSADVWAHRELFLLDEAGRPTAVAGVPPDYFSATGQRWGNPLYDWAALAERGYRWWLDRLRRQLVLFDLVRIDHFRGFQAHWEIPADAPTAASGRWVPGPGAAFFEALQAHFGKDLPLVAEDLGVITPEVEALRDRFGLPGMKILQFAFDSGAANPYLPHNHRKNAVVYTGTHDNDTTCGWWAHLSEEQRRRVRDYLGHPEEAMPWPLVRAALASVCRLAVLPMQDLLGLGSEGRMNTPGTTEGNWRWRFDWRRVPPGLDGRLAHLNALYGRC